MKKNKGMIVGFLAPAVIVFLIVFLYPIIRTVLMSFFDIESVTDSFDTWTFVGIENYMKLFKTPIFVLAMKNFLPRIPLVKMTPNKRDNSITMIPPISQILKIFFIANTKIGVLNKRYPWQEIFPCSHLSSKYCQRSSACNHVETVCICTGLWTFRKVLPDDRRG